jgi:hypothetical protein
LLPGPGHVQKTSWPWRRTHPAAAAQLAVLLQL